MIFLFFGSSLACLEPELELFEVWEISVRQIIIIANGINSQTSKLERALAWVLDELEGNQRKENHLHTIFKMIGTLVHVQLYTFSYRKPVIRPQNMPKTADWKRSKLWYFKMGPQVQPKCFRHLQHMRNNWELRKRGYLIRFGHTEALLLKKIWH